MPGAQITPKDAPQARISSLARIIAPRIPLTNPGESSVDRLAHQRRPPRDGHRVGDVVDVEELVDAEPQHVAVHRRHPLERPALGVLREQLVDARPVLARPRGPGRRCRGWSGPRRRRWRASRAATAALAPQLRGVQDVERPLAGLGACGHQAASAADAAEVGRVAGVDLDLLAGGDEQRHLDGRAGLEGGGLGAAGRAVALQAGLGVGDLAARPRRAARCRAPGRRWWRRSPPGSPAGSSRRRRRCRARSRAGRRCRCP